MKEQTLALLQAPVVCYIAILLHSFAQIQAPNIQSGTGSGDILTDEHLGHGKGQT